MSVGVRGAHDVSVWNMPPSWSVSRMTKTIPATRKEEKSTIHTDCVSGGGACGRVRREDAAPLGTRLVTSNQEIETKLAGGGGERGRAGPRVRAARLAEGPRPVEDVRPERGLRVLRAEAHHRVPVGLRHLHCGRRGCAI